MKLSHDVALPVLAAKFCLVLALLGLPLVALANHPSPPPSDTEVERLLVAGRVPSLIDGMMPQYIDALQESQLAELALTKDLNDVQKAQVQRIQTRSRETMRAALSWSQLRSIHVEHYKRTFSRDEVLAITEFYESRAGQSMQDNNPVVMTKMMQVVEQWLQLLLADAQQQLQQSDSESAAEHLHRP